MANGKVTDINSPFKDVFEALDLKEQRKAMKGAMRREGNRVKRAAIANLSSSPGGKEADLSEPEPVRRCRAAFTSVPIRNATERDSW